MKVYLGACALFFWLAWSFDADGKALDCTTDFDCEIKAQALCDAGHIEWCVKEA